MELLPEPRDAGTADVAALSTLDFSNDVSASCIETCVSGYTILCDGRTF